jgi:IS5 family transposase
MLVRVALQEDVELKQSYKFLGRKALAMHCRLKHQKDWKGARKYLRKLRTYLGRLIRDVERKVKASSAALSYALGLAKKILTQRTATKGKIYSVHAPEVQCIAKGKVHKKYEFGNKVSVATTTKGNWVVGLHSLLGNPFDGRTVPDVLCQIKSVTGSYPKRAYCDRGYKGSEGHIFSTHVYVQGTKRTSDKKIKRRLKGRSATLPIIGHLKHDHRMDRNFLLGFTGDKINALMAACAFNLRKLARVLFCLVSSCSVRAMAAVMAMFARIAHRASIEWLRVTPRAGAGIIAQSVQPLFQGRRLIHTLTAGGSHGLPHKLRLPLLLTGGLAIACSSAREEATAPSADEGTQTVASLATQPEVDAGDSPSASPQTNPKTDTETATEAETDSSTDSALSPARLTATPTSADASELVVNREATSTTITLTNDGEQAATSLTGTIDAPFEFLTTGTFPGFYHDATQSCTDTLAPGASCIVNVAFKPTMVELFPTRTLAIAYNDGKASHSLTVNFTGNVIARGAGRSRTDLPEGYDLNDYITSASVINTVLDVFGVGSESWLRNDTSRQSGATPAAKPIKAVRAAS